MQHTIILAVIMIIWPGTLYAFSLPDLVKAALGSHPSIKSQAATLRSAEARVDTARWQFWPTPAFDVQAGAVAQGGSSRKGDDYAVQLSLQQPLWTGGKLTAVLDRAEAESESREIGVEQVKQQIAIEVIQAYGNWVSAFLRHEAWDRGFKIHQQLREQVARRVKKGASSRSDLALAETRLASTNASLLSVVSQEKVAVTELRQLVGFAVTAFDLAAKRSEPRPVPEDLDLLLGQARSINPDLLEKRSLISIADADMDARKASLWPQLVLKLEYQAGSLTDEQVDNSGRAFLSMKSQLGAGLSNFSNIRESAELRAAALADVDAQLLQLEENVTNDYVLSQALVPQIDALWESLENSRDVSDSYGRQFLAGRKTWQEVMNAARDLVMTEVQLADAQASLLNVSWRLELLTQGLSTVVEGGR